MSFRKQRKMVTDTYLTDPGIVKALGPFVTDPCCPPSMPWQTAKTMYSEVDDGLTQLWKGRVWLNPPYSRPLPWVRKFVEHGNGIALTSARGPDTIWCQLLLENADLIFFPKGRLDFYNEVGQLTPGKWQSSMFVALGQQNVKKLLRLGIDGIYLGQFIV